MKPIRLPESSVPLRDFLVHSPLLRCRSAVGMWRVDESKCPMVNSTTDCVDEPGVLQTRIPAFVAASKSMLSTPTPALPIRRIEGASAIACAVIFVAERMTTASKPSSPFGSISTSCPASTSASTAA